LKQTGILLYPVLSRNTNPGCWGAIATRLQCFWWQSCWDDSTELLCDFIFINTHRAWFKHGSSAAILLL